MLSFWERMRNVCPKVNSYNGPILNKEKRQWVTSRDLDEAMLETRHFWFEDPTIFDDAWQPILEVYSRADKWPSIPPPSREVCLSTLLHTKDSSPGPDGIPYSAWRLLPEMTLQAMSSYFYDIQEETALPPTQVGVWIPKAKTGPTADFFRPLGMPNTLDRLADGSNAAHLMHHTAHLLHPSQTVMSYFKEPQRAVAEIQRILDGNFPACALLADLSKAFERVNPYWILHLLRIRGAPRWVIVYAKFVLFQRKVMHKVQGRLLPSRTIRQGVDMGRSFSVYLFCFAMDPLFHYLNRIPGVISVQAYVDDTTIAGVAEDPMWLHEVAAAYRSISTAGFHIDSHSCFRACVNDNMKFMPRVVATEELVEYWPDSITAKKYATLQEALSPCLQPGRSVFVVRISTVDLECRAPDALQRSLHTCVNLSFQQARDILSGTAMHEAAALLAGACSCKSKSCVVTNSDLGPIFLKTLDDTKYGAQSITAQAPALGLALLARRFIRSTGRWGDVSEPKTLRDVNEKPFQKFESRLRLFRQPQFSIMARCTAFNTYILSVMPYTISYFGLTSWDLNQLRQQAVKFVLRRHWLDAETMPYALKWIGVATVLDPGLAATIASAGLYLREGNTIEDLTLDQPDPAACNVRQKTIVCDLLHMWEPYVQFDHSVRALAKCQGPIQSKLRRLKQYIIEGMVRAARHRVAQKVDTEGWAGGVSFTWLLRLSGIKKGWCNGICRFAVLRWALNQDDDVWLSLRGSRHKQPCQRCHQSTDIYPMGFWHFPICESCISSQMITPMSLHPVAQALADLYRHGTITMQDLHPDTVGLLPDQLQTSTGEPGRPNPCDEDIRVALREHCQQCLPLNDCVCRACGTGDNTVGHWSRWCIVPLVAAGRLLCVSSLPHSINQIAIMSDRNTAVCSLVIAQFRRLLRQEGAFLHQNAGPPKPPTWWIDELLSQVTRQSHLQLRLERYLPPVQQACTLNHSNLQLSRVIPISLQTLHSASLQVVTRADVIQGDTIGNVDINSEFAAALVATELIHPHLECNCKIQVYKCSCGSYHMSLIALAVVGQGDILCANTDAAETTIVQFDGSAHREACIGGAALLQVGPRGYYLLKWGAMSLYPCKDNIVAEAYGAELAITLYSEYVKNCRKEQAPFLPLSTIQGDIKPLIQHLQFAGRSRRSDLVEVIDRFHKLKSRVAPAAQPEYRPREANFLADFFGGEASGSLKGVDKAPASQPVKRCRLEVGLPYELLLQHQEIILGPHQYGRTVLALREVPSCPVSLVEKFVALQDSRQAAILRQLVTATQKLTKPLCVEYIAAAEDGLGRLYARQVSAQSLTREARYLIYGQSHKEVDMSGAHYELLRRSVGTLRLPPIAQIREAIIAECQGIVQDPQALAKHLPLRLLNTNASGTLAFAHEQGYIPGGAPLGPFLGN